MGKKSRKKRERRERQEGQDTGKDVSQELDRMQAPKKSGLEYFLLALVHLGVYLSLFTPLVLSSKFYFPFVGPKSLYFMGCCEVVFFSWLLLASLYKQYRPKLNPILLALTLFLIFLTLSSILGVDFSRSFWSKYERMTGLLMWLHLFGFFLAISSTFKKKSDWQRVFLASIFVSMLVSSAALLERAGVESFKFSAKKGGTLGNTSFLGTYLLFNTFLAFYLILSSVKKRNISSFLPKKLGANWTALGCSLLAVFLAVPTMYLSGARAAYISTFGGTALIFLLWLSWRPQKKTIRIFGKVLLTLSCLIVVTSLILLFVQGTFIHQKFIELTSRARFVNWEMAQKAFMEKPVLGWGPENYTIAFTKFFNPCLFTPECGGEIWFDRTHNIVFDTLAATGALGFLTYIGLFAALFFVLRDKYFRHKSIDFWTFAVFIVIPVAYFIQNLTVFDMATSLMMFHLILGFGAFAYGSSSNQKVFPERPPTPQRKRWLIPILFLCFLFSFFNFVIQPLRSDALVIKSLQAPGPVVRVAFYKETLEASPLGKYQIRDFFAHHSRELISKNIEEIREQAAKKEVVMQEIDFVVQELEKSRRESPLDFRSILQLSQIYNVYALFDIQKLVLAEKYAKESIDLSPANQQGYWSLAQVKVYQKDFETALSLVQQSIDLEPSWLQSRKIAVQIAKFSGEHEKAKEFAQKAVEFNPDWQEEFKDILEEDKGDDKGEEEGIDK